MTNSSVSSRGPLVERLARGARRCQSLDGPAKNDVLGAMGREGPTPVIGGVSAMGFGARAASRQGGAVHLEQSVD